MASADVEAIKKELVDINSFVRERFDPVTKEVGLLKAGYPILREDHEAR